MLSQKLAIATVSIVLLISVAGLPQKGTLKDFEDEEEEQNEEKNGSSTTSSTTTEIHEPNSDEESNELNEETNTNVNGTQSTRRPAQTYLEWLTNNSTGSNSNKTVLSNSTRPLLSSSLLPTQQNQLPNFFIPGLNYPGGISAVSRFPSTNRNPLISGSRPSLGGGGASTIPSDNGGINIFFNVPNGQGGFSSNAQNAVQELENTIAQSLLLQSPGMNAPIGQALTVSCQLIQTPRFNYPLCTREYRPQGPSFATGIPQQFQQSQQSSGAAAVTNAPQTQQATTQSSIVQRPLFAYLLHELQNGTLNPAQISEFITRDITRLVSGEFGENIGMAVESIDALIDGI